MSIKHKAKTKKKKEKEKEAAAEKVKHEKLAYVEFQKNYIKENSTNPYGASLIWVRLTSKTGGESAGYFRVFCLFYFENN